MRQLLSIVLFLLPAAMVCGCNGLVANRVVPLEHLPQAPVVKELDWPYLKLYVPSSVCVSDSWIELSVETEGCRRIIFTGRYTMRERPSEHTIDMRKLGFTEEALEWLSVWWKDPDGKLHQLNRPN